MEKFCRIKKRCGNCGTENEITVLEAVLKYEGIDMDFRVYSEGGADTLDYLLVECKKCFYINYYVTIEENTTEKVRNFVSSDEYKNMIKREDLCDFDICGELEILANAPHNRIAFSFLRASWMYNDKKIIELEKKAISMSIYHFKKAIENNELSAYNLEMTNYLISELNRRLGNFTEAEEYLAKVNSQEFILYKNKLMKFLKHKVTKRKRFSKG